MYKNKNIINIVTLTFIIALIFIVFINYNNIDNFYVGGVEKKRKKIKKRKIKKMGSKFNKYDNMKKNLQSYNKIIRARVENGAMEKYSDDNRAILQKMNLPEKRRERRILLTKMAKEETKLINRRPKGMKKLKRTIFRRSNIQKTENKLQNLKETAAIKQIKQIMKENQSGETRESVNLNNIARRLKIDVGSINSQMEDYSSNKRRMILAGLITEQDGFADKFEIDDDDITKLQKTLSNKKLAKNKSKKAGKLDVQIKKKLDSLKDKMPGINLSSISRKLRLRKQSEVQEEKPIPVLRDLPVDFDDI